MTEHALVSLCCGSKTKEYTICVNFEVLTAMKVSMPVFWFVMLCGLVCSPDNGYSIFSQSLVSTYKPTQCHNPEDKYQHYIIWLSSIHGEMEIGIYQDCFPCCPSFNEQSVLYINGVFCISVCKVWSVYNEENASWIITKDMFIVLF